jgi:hypothetical protein
MSEPLHTVHVRVNDAATGKPTPVRIRFTDRNGRYLAPFGRDPNPSVDDVEGGNLWLDEKEPFTYIDGTCEIRLPADSFVVEVTKGPEYKPLREEITLGRGKIALRLQIERWINHRESGWYSADIEAVSPLPHASLLETAGEDLALVNLLAHQYIVGNRTAFPNLLAFSGQKPAFEIPGHMVVVATRNSHPHLGSLNLLYCHRVVYPLAFGGGDNLDNWTLADWCDQCHRKGGLVVWRQRERWPSPSHGLDLGEALADLLLGRVDALKPLVGKQFFHLDLYLALLRSGFRTTIVAGSGKVDLRKALGSPRTFAHLPSGTEFSYGSWIEAVRAGRTFVTFGPLLAFTVDSCDPGATVNRGLSKTIPVFAEARSWSPFDRLEVVANDFVVASTIGAGQGAPVTIDTDIALPQSGWILARCIERRQSKKGSPEEVVTAVTSPIYLRGDGRSSPINDGAATLLRQSLNETIGWIEREGRFESEEQMKRLADIIREAQERLPKSQ